jgi:hypothetical protein
MDTTVASARTPTRPGAWSVLGFGVLAGLGAVLVNLAIRAGVLALLGGHPVPFPLAPAADVIFTFVPSLLGTLLYLILRRTTHRPLRWFTVTASIVVVLSWTGPVVLVPARVVTIPVMLALLVMHTVPAAALTTALRRVDRTTA